MFGLGVVVGVMGTGVIQLIIAIITTNIAEKDKKGDFK